MTQFNLIGTTLGRFTILEELGRGGMSVVYKARQDGLNREVALKVLAPALAHDHTFIERFQHEAHNAAGLEHPHIVPVYDVGQADELHYIAMKYVAGQTLQDLLDGAGTLNMHQALAILQPVGEALSYAHRRGLIHRDIKPNNIMISNDGWVYLADFGLARDYGRSSGMTQTGMVMGTPEYMSPEQAQGLADIGPATDIYALGAVLYELLSGTTPFHADTPMAMLAARLLEEPRPLRAARSDLPPAVADVVMCALARNPDDRFDSVDEMIRLLTQAANAPAMRNLPRTEPSRQRKPTPPFVLPQSPPPAMHAPRMQSVPAAAGPYPGRPDMRQAMPQQQPAAVRCMTCQALSPHDARFCVRCGRPFTEEPVRPSRAANAPGPQVPPTPPVAPTAPRQPARRRHPGVWGGAIGTAIFFLGLAFLAVNNLWWPGILVVLGMSGLFSSAVAGRLREAVSSAVLFLGLAFIAVNNLWWPGILVLLGIVALLNALLHPRWRGWW
jgi:serine/threonine protein kinase